MLERDADIVRRAEARIGSVIRGKYRLDAILGVGGMAVVYRATHRNQARFALKMLHAEVSLNADIRARFLREGYAANSLNHHGAVLVVDDDVSEDGAAFLVMELLDGIGCEELALRLRHHVPYEVATSILIQLLDVLAAAHESGVVHRDIKPANLFLTRSGVVKVLDFGIARAREALTGGTGATGTGITLGTPAFMAQEQALGRAREIDGRTDIWAAGATFFWLMTGEYVHSGETIQELLVKAATEAARPVASACAVPSGVAGIVDRALRFRREDRWPTAGEMRNGLLQELQSASFHPESVIASVVAAYADPPSATAPPRSDSPPPRESTPAFPPRSSVPLAQAEPGNLAPGALRVASASAPTAATPITRDAARGKVRTSAWAIGAAGGASLALAAGVFALLAHDAAGLRGRASLTAADGGHGSVAANVSAAPTETAAAPAPEAAVPPPIVSTPVPSSVQTAEESPPRPTGPPVRAPLAPSPPMRAVAPPLANVVARSCEPNYTIDSEGYKRFKPECFLNKRK